jgi:hypothetical protein
MVFEFIEGFGVSHMMEEITWLDGKEKISSCISANGNYMLFALLLLLILLLLSRIRDLRDL